MLWVVFSLQVHSIFLIFELELFYNKVLLDNVIHLRIKNWHLSGKEAARHCNGGIFQEISKYRVLKIK